MKGLKYTAFILVILLLMSMIVYFFGIATGKFPSPLHQSADLPFVALDESGALGSDCDDYDIGDMFNKAATSSVIDSWESQCGSIEGFWTENSNEISCYWNPVVVSVDCDGAGSKTTEHYCEDVLMADWVCDNDLAFVGCLCHATVPGSWVDDDSEEGLSQVDCEDVIIPSDVGDKGSYCEEQPGCTTEKTCSHYWWYNEQEHKCGCTETFYCGQYCYEYLYTGGCECPPDSYQDWTSRSTYRCIPIGYDACTDGVPDITGPIQ